MNRSTRPVLAGLALWLLMPAASSAADLKVLTAGAYRPIVEARVAEFERITGSKVLIDADTAGALARRVAAAEPFDVLVVTKAAVDSIAQQGLVDAASIKPLARVGVGVGVKTGAPAPDIHDVASFRSSLLAARAIATVDPESGGSSGIYLWQLFERWGIAPTLRAHAVLVKGGAAGDRVATGEADLALQQSSEILAAKGVTLVGPIPAEIQSYTIYAGGVSSSTHESAAARALVDFLADPAALAVLREHAMEAP